MPQQQYQPSLYGHQSPYPQFAPAPPPSHAAQPAVLPPLTSQVEEAPPVKRPRGRPRKVPGTESRGGAAAAPASRGRPRGSRARGRARGGRGRGRGGKRGRASSDEEEEITDDSDSDDGNGSSRTVNLGEEMPDDVSLPLTCRARRAPHADTLLQFNSAGDNTAAPTTKFGRKISKPKTFIPTNRPTSASFGLSTAAVLTKPTFLTVHRKKRALHNPDAHLVSPYPLGVASERRKRRRLIPSPHQMCQVCREGHSQPVNKASFEELPPSCRADAYASLQLVICDSCAKGWHQLCHQPNIQEEVVASDLSWLCKTCDVKLAQSRPAVDVTVGEWVGAAEYSPDEKKEWLEGLPLHSLVNFILSVEQSRSSSHSTSSVIF